MDIQSLLTKVGIANRLVESRASELFRLSNVHGRQALGDVRSLTALALFACSIGWMESPMSHVVLARVERVRSGGYVRRARLQSVRLCVCVCVCVCVAGVRGRRRHRPLIVRPRA